MKILLVNDDGIHGEGILALCKELSKHHEIYIVAPETQMSGGSQSATYFHSELQVKKYDIDGAKEAYSVTGTPADCVYVGINCLLRTKIDLVISGINQGWNVSRDTFYSGTVGAAREALFLGIPAIASSLGSYDVPEFDVAAKIVHKLIPLYMDDPERKKYILNVNIPLLKEEEIKGYKVISSEPEWQYLNDFELYPTEEGYSVNVIGKGTHGNIIGNKITGDASACYNGYVSITPLAIEMDDSNRIGGLKKVFEKN